MLVGGNRGSETGEGVLGGVRIPGGSRGHGIQGTGGGHRWYNSVVNLDCTQG